MTPEQQRAAIANIGAVLAETERFSRAQLEDYQRGQLRQLVQHASSQSPFYRQRLAPLFRRDGSVDVSQWHSVPVLTRAEVRANGDAMRAAHLPEGHGPAYETASSGTTGTPVTFKSSFYQYAAGEAAFARACRWYGIGKDDKVCIAVDPGRADRAPATKGGRLVVGWNWPASRILDLMVQHGTTVYSGYATVLEALAELQAERHAAVAMRFLVGTSMAVTERARSLSRSAFNAPAYSAYTSKECHKIAHECPASGGFHVNSELLLVEIVDDEGRPCGPGELGRVVITPFLATAQPLIRYDQGDLARWGDACACGRAHPVISRIEGRQRHQFRFGNGHRFMPGIGHGTYRDHLMAERWQVAQVGAMSIEVRYMSKASDADIAFEKMSDVFRSSYHPALDISYRRVSAMPLTAAGKFLDYVNEYDPKE